MPLINSPVRFIRPAETQTEAAPHESRPRSVEPSSTSSSRRLSGPLQDLVQQTNSSRQRSTATGLSAQGEARFLAQQREERRNELAALSARGGYTRMLPDGDRQHAGYVFAREIDGRPIEGHALDTLSNAHDTMQQARQYLKGRGNVVSDVQYSGGTTTIDTAAGHRMRGAVLNGSNKTKHERLVDEAAASILSQAGNCGDHANVATYLHAGKLRAGEQVHRVSSKDTDHGWAELRQKQPGNRLKRLFKSAKNPEGDVVMDPWGKGPAVFAVDAQFARGGTKSDFHFDDKTGAAAHQQMQSVRAEYGPNMRASFAANRQELRARDYRYPPRKIWAPTPVVATDFASRVRATFAQADRQPNAALHHEIHAAHIARTLGANVDSAAHAAKRIVEIAKDLRGYAIAPHPAQAELDAAEIDAAQQRRQRRMTR